MNRQERRQLSKAIARGAVDLKAQEEPAVRKTISLGYTWSEERGVSGFWHSAVLRMLQSHAGRAGFRELPVESASPARGKSAIVERFLRTEDEYLLLTDPFVVFQPEDLDLLLEADASIAGAHYYTAATGTTSYSTALVAEEGGFVPLELPDLPAVPVIPEGADGVPEGFADEVAAYQALLDGPDYQPRTVASVPMGLTLLTRQVIEAVRSTYSHPFEAESDHDEDLVFCLRAAEFGFEATLVPRARVGHVHRVVL